MAIVVFGSINVDITGYGDRLPRAGETVKADRYATGLGGKGANQAVAAAKLGGDVRLVGCVGRDAFGDEALRWLEEAGLSTGMVRRASSALTGIALISVSADGENQITVVPAANHDLAVADLGPELAAFDGARVLLTQLEAPPDASAEVSRLAHGRGILVIHDPAPAPYRALTRQVLSSVDILTPNARETEALTGIVPDTAAAAMRAAGLLRDLGVGTVIVKRAAAGCTVSGPSFEGDVPAFRVETIDTVGAGDAFNGGLAVALHEGQPMREAVRFAAACGALSTTRRGAAAAAPRRAEVEALLDRG
jgi:ribokinase